MAIDLSTLTDRQALTAIYIGYFDRAADPAGIAFWEQVASETSLDLVAITSDFANQSETQAVHPFFMDPATNSPSTFITSLYLNLFNREPDAAGLTFWSDALQDAIDGVEGAISVGQIITSIIEGAVDVDGGTQDRTTILNKIEVGLDWTVAAETAEIDYATNAAAQASAKAVIDGVTADEATVTTAKAATDTFFDDDTGPVTGTPGETKFLTSETDVMDGTADDDTFNAYIAQNPFAGGVSNTLSSADRLDGGAGNDRLYAEITGEFVGVVGNVSNIDIQPRIQNIEELDFEARESTFLTTEFLTGGAVVVDAKNITDHVEIGSYFSDGDLKIENMTTLTSGGSARNTSELTVTMDHTDNFNSDEDASDLTVLLDNDYLLSGQESEGRVFYFLLDEDAELAGLADRLNNIDVDGIRFNITGADGSVTPVVIEAAEANTAGTHQGFVNALQPALQALIADGTLPAGTTLTLDPTRVDRTFIDDGSQSADIPAIVLTTGDGSAVTATGFSRIADEIGEYDVYGRFGEINEVAEQPIAIDVDLHKAGRGGEGGDLIIGGKSTNTDEDSIADGIEVININVLGAGDDDPTGMTKPSNVGTITSTGNELEVVNIVTDAAFASGTTYASLTVRNGFDENTNSNVESGDLKTINADGFLGDLTLGDIDATYNAGRITNADTITAQGGGDVTLGLNYNGTETAQAYSVTTGSGSDDVDIALSGDALDFQNSSLNVSTGGGADKVNVDFNINTDTVTAPGSSEFLNTTILNNVTIDTGDGADMITVADAGSADIKAGSGNDFVNTSGSSSAVGSANEVWAFNYDALRATTVGNFAPDEIPGEALSLAYLSDATVTVTLSGAGVGSYGDGGGVMSQGAAGAVAEGGGRDHDGYQASFTIQSLINGNEHFGDQRDVNAAVIAAIENDAVLNNLLSATVGANNVLVIASKTSGAFDATDLLININQETYTSAANANSVNAEARMLAGDSSLPNQFAGTTAGSQYAAGSFGADLATAAGADAWFDGLSVRNDGTNNSAGNTHTNGAASTSESDNTIDAGEGNDLIVLSTDGTGTALPIAPTTFTKSPATSLINDASNETIVLTGNSFGDDTVMNFTAAEGEAGLDFLDFTAYLTSQTDVSPGTAGTGAASFNDIVTTLGTDLNDVAANEVAIFNFTATAGESFAGLNAAQVTALFNNTTAANDWGSLSAAASDVVFNQSNTAVVDGAGKAVIMIENNANDGEYKVFELTWDAGSTTAPSVAVADLGSLDFGDTLDNAGTDTFLVGSAAYDALFV
ncbi:DUF4214 domain-containing protein [Sulfitobacter geojensis]|uniref:DUF4214 domain-containing protein n=1 Tax=Sulfitobacter geojensis TaxID=1342299 RepID=UPI00249007C2|nr:DUF4214 domain-containing protein [Sulfitobacter geojensis]